MGKFNFKNQEDFEKMKTEAEAFYATIQEVFCPYFKEKVAFNVKGLKHLKFKFDRQPPPMQREQFSLFKT